MNLPMPEYGKTDKETIQILMDTTVKLRKELEYALYHLDEQNIPMMKSIVGDIEGAYTAIEQNEQQISLLATDLSGAKAQITVQAGQISSLVTTTQGQQTQINQNASSITLLSSTVDGHTAQISVQAGLISSKVGYGEVISSINQSAESIDIDATRINLYGITNVNDVLQIGYTTNDAEIRFRGWGGGDPYVRIYSGGYDLNVACSTMAVNGNIYTPQTISARGGIDVQDSGISIVNTYGTALTAYGNITAWGGNTNFNTDSFRVNGSKVALAMASQDIKFQVYGGALEVFEGGSLAGTITFD